MAVSWRGGEDEGARGCARRHPWRTLRGLGQAGDRAGRAGARAEEQSCSLVLLERRSRSASARAALLQTPVRRGRRGRMCEAEYAAACGRRRDPQTARARRAAPPKQRRHASSDGRANAGACSGAERTRDRRVGQSLRNAHTIFASLQKGKRPRRGAVEGARRSRGRSSSAPLLPLLPPPSPPPRFD